VQGKLISQNGDKYPIVKGKPILVKQISDFHVTPPQKEKVSQNIPIFSVPSSITNSNALILHLGSGNVPCPDPRVISLDILPCENADIVGEAEELPFFDNTFDYVESGAVFEHLYDPLTAIKEVKRVLKPGCSFRIDAAFMQSYHGFPEHYYNLTPQAMETALVDDFMLELSCVPDSATPLWTVVSLIERFLSFLPQKDRVELMHKPLTEVLENMKEDLTRKNRLLASFDEYAMRSLAASFVVIAKKPEDYDRRIACLNSQGDFYIEQWQSLKRAYYTTRMELMIRHHEVLLYRRLCHEIGRDNAKLPAPQDLDTLFAGCMVNDMFDQQAIRNSINCLHTQEAQLRKLRDQWIAVYSGGTTFVDDSRTRSAEDQLSDSPSKRSLWQLMRIAWDFGREHGPIALVGKTYQFFSKKIIRIRCLMNKYFRVLRRDSNERKY